MDMDRPQSPAWARGGRRRSALRARRPRAVAGLLILQKLSWGPHGGQRSRGGGTRPFVLSAKPPDAATRFCYLLWPEGLTAVLQGWLPAHPTDVPGRQHSQLLPTPPWLPSSWAGEGSGARSVLSRSPPVQIPVCGRLLNKV